MKNSSFALSILIGSALLIPIQATAASDPRNPDCPIVSMVQGLARKVDVYNTSCESPFAFCEQLYSEITTEADQVPDLIEMDAAGTLLFDPEVVFETIDYQGAYPHLFDCDPKDEDCNGKTVNLGEIRANIEKYDRGYELLLSFPTSNIAVAAE